MDFNFASGLSALQLRYLVQFSVDVSGPYIQTNQKAMASEKHAVMTAANEVTKLLQGC